MEENISNLIICQACLKRLNQGIEMHSPIVEVDMDDEISSTYIECFKACTQLNIEDGQVKHICEPCSNELRHANEFRTKARISQYILKSTNETVKLEFKKDEYTKHGIQAQREIEGSPQTDVNEIMSFQSIAQLANIIKEIKEEINESQSETNNVTCTDISIKIDSKHVNGQTKKTHKCTEKIKENRTTYSKHDISDGGDYLIRIMKEVFEKPQRYNLENDQEIKIKQELNNMETCHNWREKRSERVASESQKADCDDIFIKIEEVESPSPDNLALNSRLVNSVNGNIEIKQESNNSRTKIDHRWTKDNTKSSLTNLQQNMEEDTDDNVFFLEEINDDSHQSGVELKSDTELNFNGKKHGERLSTTATEIPNDEKAFAKKKKRMIRRRKKILMKSCTKKCRLRCSSIFDSDNRIKIYTEYWSLVNKDKQLEFIKNRMMILDPVKRQLRYKYANRKLRGENYAYFFDLNDEKVRVCSRFFLHTLGTSSTTVDKVKKNSKLIIKRTEKCSSSLIQENMN